MKGPNGSGVQAASNQIENNPALMNWWLPESGLRNRVGNNSWGDLVELGGAVPIVAGAGPDGTPVYRFSIASGGVLKTTGARVFSSPIQIIIICKQRTAGFCIWASTQNTSGVLMNQVANTFGMVAGSNITKATTALAFHCYDTVWWGSTYGAVSIDGAAYTRGATQAAVFGGLVIGSANDGTTSRADLDVCGIYVLEGFPGDPLHTQIYQDIQRRWPSLAVATPVYPSNRAGNPSWAFGSPWKAIPIMGQSNCQGLGTIASTAFAANTFALGYDFKWNVAADPITAGLTARETIDNGGITATHAGHVGLLNAMQAHWGVPTVGLPLAAGGSSFTTELDPLGVNYWNVDVPRGLLLNDCLAGSIINRIQEAQFYGGTIPFGVLHQGETEGQFANNAQQDLWPARAQRLFDTIRARVGLPNLPFFFAQLQPAPGASYAVQWTRMRDVIQPQLQSSNQFMVTVPDGAYIAGSVTDHLHLETKGGAGGLEGFYAAVAASAIAHGL